MSGIKDIVKIVAIFWLVSTFCAGQTKDKQYIFSRSSQQNVSTALGVSAVSAYVVLPEGSRNGIYITAVQPGGLWRDMGIKPGNVLLTLNNQAIESCRTADTVINKAGNTGINYAFAKMKGGVPVVVRGSCSASGSTPFGSDSASTKQQKTFPEPPITELESHMIDLINRDRARNGNLPPVRADQSLTRLARSYAEYMLRHGSFGHVDPDGRNPQDRAKQAGLTIGVNENLAFQSRGWKGDRDLVDAAEAEMMDEPPNQMNHRGNLLHPARQYVGVGVARSPGMLMMVQEFTDHAP
ncbi:MAG: hypothetical protein K2W82_12330 [Candidatus Obscuribacterales bacterium]|nr:hypothetical protein [Candidatus Obscuribacterales bacterium]